MDKNRQGKEASPSLSGWGFLLARSQRWESTLQRVFAAGFRLIRAEYGQTTVRTETWSSVWFWFERIEA